MPKDYAAMSSLSPTSSLTGVSGDVGGGFHHSSSKMISSLSSMAGSSVSMNNAHCSLGQAGSSSGSGMGPIMEIREIAGYGNACVPPDKYWNHQHGHSACSMVSGSPSVRHSAVYPPVFYTPPPPQSYPSCSSVPAGPGSVTAPQSDWNCTPIPPPTESYPHFLYSQYPSHNDFSNFLTIPPSSCYETDMLMLGGMPVPGQGSGLSVPAQTSETNGCKQPSLLQLPPSMVFPPQVYDTKNLSEKHLDSAIPTPSSSTTDTSSSEGLDEDSEEDDDDRHIISIEDDDNGHSSIISLCTLCRKPALADSSSLNYPLSQPVPTSPQLSKFLGDIDDNELDISVCSGDIEIGGIEDEMIQQGADVLHISQKISIGSLAQLVGVPVSTLGRLDGRHHRQTLGTKDAVLCSKCQRMVDLADSLEKQLNSVLNTLKQIIKYQDNSHSVRRHGSNLETMKLLSTVSTQTENSEVDENFLSNEAPMEKYRCIILLRGRSKSEINDLVTSGGGTNDESTFQLEPQQMNEKFPNKCPTSKRFLCHECGRTFNCGRNLGKHLKRTHSNRLDSNSSPNMISCTRESCTKKCSDNAKLKSHIKSHSDDKRHFCGHCLKLFSSKSNLAAHLKLGTCSEKQTSDYHLPSMLTTEKTSRNSTGEHPLAPYRCDNCGLTFRTELRYRRHTKVSCLISKLFQCNSCNKLFAKQSELQAHQTVHSGVRPFPCDICGLTFATKGNQRVHQRTHSLEKRFKCGKCGKGFTRNQTLQIHMSNLHES